MRKSENNAEGTTSDVATLGNVGRMITFTFQGRCIRFLGPKCLIRFLKVKKWHEGYIEVEADYGSRVEEDYIDLLPILENLYIDAKAFLANIKKVEVQYA